MLKHCKLSKILQPVLLTTRFWDSLCRRVNLVLQRKDLLQLCTERKLSIFWLDFKISSRVENLKVSNSEFGETYVLVLITEGFHYRPQTKFAKVMFLHLSVSHSVHRRGSTWAGTAPGQVHPWADTSPWAGTPPGRYTPQADTPHQCMLGYGQQTGSTHPTGMHSCCSYIVTAWQT